MQAVKPVERGDIYIADVSRISVSQNHTLRPVVVVSNDNINRSSNQISVAFISSSNLRDYPYHVSLPFNPRVGLRQPSRVLCENVYAISKDTLVNYVGSVRNSPIEDEIDNALLHALGIATAQ